MPAQTIGDLISILANDTTASDKATAAAVAADQAAKDALALASADKVTLAAGLVAVGDTAVVNPDGTVTAYLVDKSPDGFHTEILKSASSPLPQPVANPAS